MLSGLNLDPRWDIIPETQVHGVHLKAVVF